MSTLFVNNLNTASGTTITLPTGKTLVGTDEGAFRVPGTILQVVQNVTANHETISAQAWTATSTQGTITPKSSTSKILVQITGTIRAYNNGGSDARGAFRIYKSVGGGSYSQLGTHQMTHRAYDYGGSGRLDDIPFHMQYLDSPSTTSAIIYKLYGYKEAGSNVEVGPDGDDEQCVTLMEIAQ